MNPRRATSLALICLVVAVGVAHAEDISKVEPDELRLNTNDNLTPSPAGPPGAAVVVEPAVSDKDIHNDKQPDTIIADQQDKLQPPNHHEKSPQLEQQQQQLHHQQLRPQNQKGSFIEMDNDFGQIPFAPMPSYYPSYGFHNHRPTTRDPLSLMLEQLRNNGRELEREMQALERTTLVSGEGQTNTYFSNNGVAYVKSCTIKRV